MSVFNKNIENLKEEFQYGMYNCICKFPMISTLITNEQIDNYKIVIDEDMDLIIDVDKDNIYYNLIKAKSIFHCDTNVINLVEIKFLMFIFKNIVDFTDFDFTDFDKYKFERSLDLYVARTWTMDIEPRYKLSGYYEFNNSDDLLKDYCKFDKFRNHKFIDIYNHIVFENKTYNHIVDKQFIGEFIDSYFIQEDIKEISNHVWCENIIENKRINLEYDDIITISSYIIKNQSKESLKYLEYLYDEDKIMLSIICSFESIKNFIIKYSKDEKMKKFMFVII